jgi:uncharacterized protein YyaL (SSP411 family)
MRRLNQFGLLLSFCFAVVAVATEWHYLKHTQIRWRVYDQAAFAEARKTNRPLFVFIYSDKCQWCREYETQALEVPFVSQRLERDFIPVAVDFDNNPELGRHLGAKLVPTSLILSPDGEKILRFYGIQGAMDLADTLDKTLALWRRGELAQPDFGEKQTCCPLPGAFDPRP